MFPPVQQSDGETYLDIVGYVKLGQGLWGVHPGFLWNDTNGRLNHAVLMSGLI